MLKNKKMILRGVHVTEKASTLQGLVDSESNACTKKCKTPKFVFLVDPKANKGEIKEAVEKYFADQKITVTKVNTIMMPRKKKRVKGSRKMGFTAQVKKAVVSLKAGDKLNLEA